MADKEVRIDFKTTADTKGAKEVQKEAKKTGREFVKTGRVSEEALERVERDARDLREEVEKIDGLDPRLKKDINGVADSMDRAAASGRKMAAAKNQVRKSSRNSSLAVLEFSRAVEDAQYGIRGVLNNIPSLVMQLGGTAGLAGVISLAAVGVTQLTSALGGMGEKSGDTAEEVAKAKDEFDELVDSLVKLKEEANEANYEKFLSSLDAAKNRLDVQNEQIKANIRLLILQRQAANDVANAQDALDRTEIAIKQATDPNYTEKDAAIERANLDLRKLAREEAEKEAKIQDEVDKARQKILDAQREQSLEVEKSLKLKEREAELEEKIADLKSLRAFRGALEGQRSEVEGQIADPVRAFSNSGAESITEFDSFLQGLRDRLTDLNISLTKTPEAEEIEARLIAAEREAKKTESRINSTRSKIDEIRGNINILEAQQQATLEQAELARSKIDEITELEKRNIVRQTELQVSIKGATEVFQENVIPALEAEVARSGVALDEFGKRALEGIREMATNQTADLEEKDRVITALKVLQTRGVDQTGAILNLLESEIAKRADLERRIRALELQINRRR